MIFHINFEYAILGLSMADLERLSIGLINDMYCESRNDSFLYAILGNQAAMDAF
jgi:hypothetical protein